jgi:hypothetical protein
MANDHFLWPVDRDFVDNMPSAGDDWKTNGVQHKGFKTVLENYDPEINAEIICRLAQLPV